MKNVNIVFMIPIYQNDMDYIFFYDLILEHVNSSIATELFICLYAKIRQQSNTQSNMD